MTLLDPIAPPQTWPEWLASQPDEAKPTHRLRLRLHVDIDVVMPPWSTTADAMEAVVRSANRVDPSHILQGIDYERDRFLPSSTRIIGAHADCQRL